MEHCTRSLAPQNVSMVLRMAIEDWCAGRQPLHHNETPTSIHRVISHQNRLGWDAWIRGFFSIRWAQFVKSEYERKYSAPYQGTTFLPRLLKLFWKCQNDFWEQYLEDIHKADSRGSSSETVTELQTKIRSLHRLSQQVLAAHRTLYFHEDVETYLQRATLSQMKTYILANYEKPIMNSLAQAKLIYAASPRIFQIPGFIRRNQPPPARQPPQPGPLGAHHFPHKHTKWKPSATIVERFRQYFQHPTTQQNP